MHPVDALQEIAFWLERDLAPSFKVQAFRTAAAAIAGRSDDDVEARLRSGALARTKGVGSRSLEVIGQALEGRVPDYLQALRDRERETTSEAGAGLLADLRGDLHCHSEWSDGGTPIPLMVEAARTLGREYIALTDHSPNLTVAHGLTAERLTEQLGVLDDVRADHPDVRVLSGIEVDILEDGTLDQTPAMLDRLDVVVASVHSKLRADRRTMTERMLGGIRDPHTNVLGHCTGRLVQGSRGERPQSTFDARAVFEACVEHDVAVEINSRPERQDPPDDLIQLALEVGCLFSIDTDAHAPGQLDFLRLGAERAAQNGVPADRIVTTWPVERLLAWAHPQA
ncbi:PHP domain-containing protein [Curtobacterium sp. MCBD17_034]|uniref:PHP domain-containing protein n=1 Tax=unclassified Curtobacterium TaxID=257496 RepID=UPI000DA7ADD0|nr:MULTISPECIES: PHP domain-containing protein [unclassified Curtobacterium]PZF61331.1 PHP domain-containing protein [Curtobacterium sp. MCBD17_034]PZM40582.1 PHP domain-containing protein [Curtobacterium sp. MCBD17_031]